MHIVLAGLNHRTAPVAIREQLTLADCSLHMALDDLGSGRSHLRDDDRQVAKSHLTESVILSTCNRLELYAVVAGDPATGLKRIERFLGGLQGIPAEELHPHLYFMVGHEAVTHLMRVATGLDSMILGEPQILGQVSRALESARTAGTTGPILSHLFDRAAHTGKRARTETVIGRYTTSIGHAAAQLVEDKLGDLAQIRALVVGAGEMAEVAAQALQSHGVQQLNFINRTYSRAESMARQYMGQALSWYHLPAALAMADVVVTATGAPHIVIHAGDVRPTLSERSGRPLLFVDIAVPRDVEESVGTLTGVRRYDIDELQSTVDANLAQRQAAVPDVETIIAGEVTRFEDWVQGRQVLPVLVELRHRAKEIAEAELGRNGHRLGEMEPFQQEMVNQIVHRIVNKLLHEPTVRLKAAAADGNGVEYAHAIRELFALDVTPIASVPALNGRSQSNGRSYDDPGADRGTPLGS